MADVVYTYDPAQNPEDLALPGVPMRDLTQADVEALPEYIRAAIALAPYFVAVAPAEAALPPTAAPSLAWDAAAQLPEQIAAHTPPAVEEAAERAKAKRPRETKALTFEPEGADQIG